MSATTSEPRLATLMLRVYLPFAAAYFLSYLYRAVNSVVGPLIAGELDLSATELGLLTSAYFIMFSLIQVPMGVALDRFGPRLVQAVLLVIAACGAALFGIGGSMAVLVAGRVLIGLGVAAGLMGALKVITLWFRAEHWPMMNGLLMAAGGLGSLMATAPTQAALGVISWHSVFFVLSGMTLAVAALLYVAVPEKPGTRAGGTLAQQMTIVGGIMRDGYFWRMLPFFAAQQATFIAVQTLWIGPWLRDVAGLDPAARGQVMFWVALAMTLGFLSSGVVAGLATRIGVSNFATGTVVLSAFVAMTGALAAVSADWLPLWTALPLWCAFGFLGSYVIVYYPVLTKAFPLEVSGRVTTSVNFLMFSTVFAVQWGVGRVLDLFAPNATGGYAPAGYACALLLLTVLQVAAVVWLLVSPAVPQTQR